MITTLSFSFFFLSPSLFFSARSLTSCAVGIRATILFCPHV